MKKHQIINISVVLIILILIGTNPSLQQHKEAFTEYAFKKSNLNDISNNKNSLEVLGNELGKSLGKTLIENIIQRDNYYVLSLTQITYEGNEKIIGIGILGNVWIFQATEPKTIYWILAIAALFLILVYFNISRR